MQRALQLAMLEEVRVPEPPIRLSAIGVDVTPPKGTIYIWAPVPDGHTSASYCELVLEESGVVLSPGAAYGQNGEGFFRISLTVPDERLAEAVERLRGSLGS